MIWAEGHLEVGDFRAEIRDSVARSFGEGFEKIVGLEVCGRLEVEGGVEPSEKSFAFRVGVVIDFHDGRCGLLCGEDLFDPSMSAFACSCGEGVDGFSWETFFEGATGSGEGVRVECVALVDHEDVSLFQLFEKDVGDFWREGCSRIESQDSAESGGVAEDAEGSDMEAVSVDSSQGVGDGGDEVGTTAHGFGDEDVGPRGFREFGGCVDEGVEAAAEAAAGNFFGSESAVAEHLGVDEFAALVVGDEADAKVLLGEVLCESSDGGGFSCAEETADHDVFSGHFFGGKRVKL